MGRVVIKLPTHIIYHTQFDNTMSITSYAEELCINAAAIASTGKGILAADESTGKKCLLKQTF